MADGMTTLPAQLRAEMLRQKVSVQQLLDRCLEIDREANREPRVNCSRSALDRKLREQIRMNAEEIQACADALKHTVQWPPLKCDAPVEDESSTDAPAAEAVAS